MLKAVLSMFERSQREIKLNHLLPEIKLEDCWMIGDSEEDVRAAKIAGLNFLNADEWRKGGNPCTLRN